jgi:hypothetical protein
MGRRSTGTDALDQARSDIAAATTVAQLRIAQAVVMPIDLRLSLAATAQVIGMSPGWVARARMRYINEFRSGKKAENRGGRRNNLLTLDEENRYVQLALARREYRRSVASDLQAMLGQKKKGHQVALSTAYKMIRRVTEMEASRTLENAEP